MLDRDCDLAHHPPRRRQDEVADAIPHAAVIGDRELLAGARVPVRMPGERAVERAVERGVELLLQGVGQLDGEAARFHNGDGAAADLDHVGVDGVIATPTRSRRRVPAERRRREARADPAVAVPHGPAAPEGEAMHHAVAEKPMVARGLGPHRVRPHPQIAAVEPVRDHAGDGEVLEHELRPHRRMDPDQVRVIGLRQAAPVESGHQQDPAFDDPAHG